MRLVILVLTFLAAGACILAAAACAVALRLPPRATQAVLRVAARLLDSATRRARALFGTGRYM